MAINHYIEARANAKAVGACLTSRQWSKAAQLVETLDRDAARPHLKALARHYEEAGSHVLAERFFVEADAPQLAVEMYTKVTELRVHGVWSRLYEVYAKYYSDDDILCLVLWKG